MVISLRFLDLTLWLVVTLWLFLKGQCRFFSSVRPQIQNNPIGKRCTAACAGKESQQLLWLVGSRANFWRSTGSSMILVCLLFYDRFTITGANQICCNMVEELSGRDISRPIDKYVGLTCCIGEVVISLTKQLQHLLCDTEHEKLVQ